jgi:hypothetical protein
MPGAQHRDDRDGEEDKMIPGIRWGFFERKDFVALRLALHYDSFFLDGNGRLGVTTRHNMHSSSTAH